MPNLVQSQLNHGHWNKPSTQCRLLAVVTSLENNLLSWSLRQTSRTRRDVGHSSGNPSWVFQRISELDHE